MKKVYSTTRKKGNFLIVPNYVTHIKNTCLRAISFFFNHRLMQKINTCKKIMDNDTYLSTLSYSKQESFLLIFFFAF